MLPSIQRRKPLAPLSLDNRTWITAWSLVLLIGGASATSPAAALDLDAGDYVAAPAGTTLGLLYLQAAAEQGAWTFPGTASSLLRRPPRATRRFP